MTHGAADRTGFAGEKVFGKNTGLLRQESPVQRVIFPAKPGGFPVCIKVGGLLLLQQGPLFGQRVEVLRKAITVCLSCIGIG